MFVQCTVPYFIIFVLELGEGICLVWWVAFNNQYDSINEPAKERFPTILVGNFSWKC